MIEQLEHVTHHPYFVAFDLAFHVIVIVHVVHHACRMLGRIHGWLTQAWPHTHNGGNRWPTTMD